MNLWCRILGHTWVAFTYAPEQRWFTTKAGQTLVQDDVQEGPVRHVDRCQRCGEERDAGPRRHDADRPAEAGSKTGKAGA